MAIMDLSEGEVRLPLLRAAETTRTALAELLGRIMSREEWMASHPRYALAC
jgi:hypothetical protein